MITDSVEDTLDERQAQYGDYETSAKMMQQLMSIFGLAPNYHGLSAVQKEAYRMILLKMVRSVNGDPTVIDNAHDIAGYAKLIEADLIAKEISTKCNNPIKCHSLAQGCECIGRPIVADELLLGRCSRCKTALDDEGAVGVCDNCIQGLRGN